MNVPVSLGLLLTGWLALSSSNIQAQQKAPDLAQVLLNLQNRLQKAEGLSLEVDARAANGNRYSARIMALRPNFFKIEG